LKIKTDNVRRYIIVKISHIPMAGIEHGNTDNTIYIVFKRYYSAIVK